MKLLGNIIWIVFGGLFWSLSLFLTGLLCCITIVGIPIGIQVFKLAIFVLWPFGKGLRDVNVTGFKTFLNILWAIFFGWEICLGHLITGALFYITIIGIPFGKKYFEIAMFTLLPFGKEIVVLR